MTAMTVFPPTNVTEAIKRITKQETLDISIKLDAAPHAFYHIPPEDEYSSY